MAQGSNNVISLAEVRAAWQQLARPAAEPTPQAAPLTWRQSARGNWWTHGARSDPLSWVPGGLLLPVGCCPVLDGTSYLAA
jgi:hypothetical protein